MGVQIPPGLPILIRPQPLQGWAGAGRVRRIGDLMELNLRLRFEVVKQFLREVKTELKKVTWPSRKDTLSGTIVVLVTVFIMAIFLGLVDTGLSNLIKVLLKRAAG